MKSVNLLALAATLASTVVMGCGTGAGDGASSSGSGKADTAPKQITASRDSRFEVLEGIWAIREQYDQQHELVLRLFETGGGDPAMNGDMLVLNIMPGSMHEPGVTFETGINVRAVETVTLDAAGMKLVVATHADTADADGNIGSEARTYSLTYAVGSKGEIGDTLTVEAKGTAPERVSASKDGRWEVLDGIWAVRTLEDGQGNVVVRLFETGGGDPAMNGDMLLLHIMPVDPMAASRTFETGINVAAVKDARLDAGASQVVLQVSADIMGDDGNITQEARSYALRYAVDSRGAVAEALTVQRTE